MLPLPFFIGAPRKTLGFDIPIGALTLPRKRSHCQRPLRTRRQSQPHLEVLMDRLARLRTTGGLFALGLLVGFWLRGGPPGGAPVAAQGKPAVGAEERLRQRGIELPPVSKPTNTLVNAVRVGDLLFVSGTGPGSVDGKPIAGRLGQDMDVAKGKAAARRVGLQILSVVKAELGSLDKVQRLVKTFGMVNATADFTQHPQVINGFSDLMVEVFGDEAGKGSRSAVGLASLPGGIPVEIEAVFQVRP
jgi:enamine deaminase RidA (YjgF/YER057c/UK114 family)